jgi:hypothetical protein
MRLDQSGEIVHVRGTLACGALFRGIEEP